MKLRELLQLLQATATEIKVPQPYLVGGTPRDKVLHKLENISDLDITNNDKSIDYLAQEFYNRLKKQYKVVHKIFEDHSSIFLGNLKVDFSSNFVIPNIDQLLSKMGIGNITNLQREIYSRDFTCNSLLMNLQLTEIYDTTKHAFQDIHDKKIRTCL